MRVKDPKLEKLLEAFRDLHEKQGLVLEEISEILGGGIGIGEKMKAFYATWQELWTARYRTAYTFTFAKDAPHVKRMIRAFGVEELQARASSYIKSDDPFYARTKHTFGMFVATINAHVGIAAESRELPSACRHQPLCQDDAACTKRTQREVLGPADVNYR